MYKIGDILEVATTMLTFEIPWKTEIMVVTNVYPLGRNTYYSFNGNDNVHYPESRIIRQIEEG